MNSEISQRKQITWPYQAISASSNVLNIYSFLNTWQEALYTFLVQVLKKILKNEEHLLSSNYVLQDNVSSKSHIALCNQNVLSSYREHDLLW